MHRVRFVIAALLAAIVPVAAVAQTSVTLDATSGTSTIATNYTTTGGLTLDLGFFAEYLIVGGGGGGGNNHGGGGGAGGFRTNLGGSLLQITSTNNTVTVGGGGAGGTAGASTAAGNDGGSSSAFGITSIGGGGGGARADQGSPASFYVGRNGGSGGGGGGIGITPPAGGAGTAGQGFNGGSGTGGGAEASGGGGGGTGVTGANSSAGVAGAGGAGLASTITGSSRFYAGGGGGGTGAGTIGAGGSGIGGNGNNGGSALPGTGGATNTGSGGGGGGGAYGAGGAGAAGVVIVRYAGSPAGTGGAVTTGSGSAAGTTLHTFTTTGNSTLSIPLATRLAATLTGSLTGSGTFTYGGPGSLTLAGVNASTGPTVINGGTLVTTATGLLPTAATVTVASGAALQLGASQTVGGLAGAGSVVLGSNTLATAGGGQTFSGVVSGLGGVTKTGVGTATFSGANTFSGQLAVAQGTLVLGTWNDVNTNGSAGNSSLPIQLGSASTSGTLSYGGPNIGTTDAGLTKGLTIGAGGGSVAITASGGRGSFVHVTGSTITGNGTFSVSAPQARFIVIGSAQYTGPTVVQQGELQGNVQLVSEATPFGAGANGLGSAVTVNPTGVLTIYTGGNTAITRTVLIGSLAGSGTVRGEASGPIVLRTGGDGTSTTFAGAITDSFDSPGTGKVAVAKSGAGTQTLSGANTFTGGVSLEGGVLAVGSSGALGSSGAISFGGGTLRYSAGNATDYSGRFSTAPGEQYAIDTNSRNVTFASALTSAGGSLVKSGSGTLTLSAANTFSGGASVQAGTLATSGNDRLPTAGSVAIAAPGTLSLGGSQTVASVTGSGAIQLGVHTLTTGSTSSVFAGRISGRGGLTKAGPGTFTLTGSNSFTGDTFVNAGTLVIDSTTALDPFAIVTTAAGGTLQVNRNIRIGYYENNGTLTGSGTLSSVFTLTNSGTLGSVIADDGGASGVLKRTAGTSTLTAVNTYTGQTRVQA
ncbi:MAG: beta strand repeat-containing protein [Planctomycetia bacterium]